MEMSASSAHHWLHRLAVSTVVVALVTLTFGALVTSKNAGMAFRDWPTSDGHGMFAYPWLNDFARDWDKFLEHGHRLAGALIGMWSIGLVTTAFAVDSRPSVRRLSIAILIGVICQGLLGGFRVQLDERGLAMVHGLFAAIVFSLMGSLCLITGPRWENCRLNQPDEGLGLLKLLSAGVALGLLVQYVLGGMIRHQGSGLHEHLALGVAAGVLLVANGIACALSSSVWIRRSGLILALAALGQVGLGLATWVFKFGFTPIGYVAVADSIQQVSLRTAHTVWGIMLLMLAVTHAVKVFRVAAVSPRSEPRPVRLLPVADGGMK